MPMKNIVLATLSIMPGLALLGCVQSNDMLVSQVNEPVTSTLVSSALQSSETAKLNAWFEDKFEQELMLSPTSLTYLELSVKTK